MKVLELHHKIQKLKCKWVDRGQYEAASDIREIEKDFDKIIEEIGIKI